MVVHTAAGCEVNNVWKIQGERADHEEGVGGLIYPNEFRVTLNLFKLLKKIF